MNADDTDTRIAFVELFSETRELMAKSADNIRRSFDHRAAAARLTRLAEEPTQPARLALPALEPVPPNEVLVDLTGIQPLTERDLSIGTGVSLRSIAEAVRKKKIRATRRKGKPRLLDIASTALWLQAEHRITPWALENIHRSEEN